MTKTKRYTGVLFKNNDKVLLCKRNNTGELPGVWSIPAGKLDKNENPLVGARREFLEETNLKIKDGLNLCGFVTRKTRDNLNEKGLMYVFLLETDVKMIPDLENAIDGSEHTECGYFGIEDLPFGEQNDQLYTLIRNILLKH